MILDYTHIMAMGFRIGRDIPQATVELAIETAEMYYVKPSVDTETYETLITLESDSPLLVGGEYTDSKGGKHYVAGMNKALAHIAYAELLRMNINATTFGSVQKTDDSSENVNPAANIKYHLAVGLQYAREVVVALGAKWVATTGVNRESYYTRRKEGAWR